MRSRQMGSFPQGYLVLVHIFDAGLLIINVSVWERRSSDIFSHSELKICISLRIQVCPKEEISPNQSYSGDEIETINPTRSGRVWILRVSKFTVSDFSLVLQIPCEARCLGTREKHTTQNYDCRRGPWSIRVW